MYETYLMLGEQRELELLREAQRLHAGKAAKDGGVRCNPGSRLVSILRRSHVVLIGRRRSTTRAVAKSPRSQLDS